MVIFNDVYNKEKRVYEKAEQLVKDTVPRIVTYSLHFIHENVLGKQW